MARPRIRLIASAMMGLATASAASAVPTVPLAVPRLDDFDPGDAKAVRRAFRDAAVLRFGQPWRDAKETGFRGGDVRVGWRGDRFLYLARLSDRHVFTSAAARNQRLWELGDVLEVFAGESGKPGYLEYHTAPNNTVLQLYWPRPGAFHEAARAGGLARFTKVDRDAKTVVRRVRGGWEVYGELPSLSVLGRRGSGAPLLGKVWDVNFGRYDYDTDGRTFRLSATAGLTVPSFHRKEEWNRLHFVDPPST